MARLLTRSNSDYVDCGSTPAPLSNALTMVAWINRNSAGQTMNVCGKFGGTAGTQGYVLQVGSTNKMVAAVANGGGTIVGISGQVTTFGTNTWYHLALTYDGSAVRGYVNGVLEGTPGSTSLSLANPGNFRIGENSDNNNATCFDGSIAEVAVWKTVLTATQLKAMYNGASPVSVHADGLLGYWPLLGDSPEADYSGNRNPGTPHGTAVSAHPPVRTLLLGV